MRKTRLSHSTGMKKGRNQRGVIKNYYSCETADRESSCRVNIDRDGRLTVTIERLHGGNLFESVIVSISGVYFSRNVIFVLSNVFPF